MFLFYDSVKIRNYKINRAGHGQRVRARKNRARARASSSAI